MDNIEFNKIISESRLSKKEFGLQIGVEYRTLMNYSNGATPIPKPVQILTGILKRNLSTFPHNLQRGGNRL